MASLSDYATPQALGQAAYKAQQAGDISNILSEKAMLGPDKLRQTLMEHFNYNEDLARQRATAQTQATTAFPRANEMYQNIFDPFARDRLISQYVAQEQEPLSLYNTLLEQRGQTVNQITGGVGNLLGSLAQMGANQYNIANQGYNTLWGQYQQSIAEQQFAQQMEAQRQTAQRAMEFQALQNQQQQAQSLWDRNYKNQALQQTWNIANLPPKTGGLSPAQTLELLQKAQDQKFLQAAAQNISYLTNTPGGNKGLRPALSDYLSQRPDLASNISTLFENISGQNVGVQKEATANKQQVLQNAAGASSYDEARNYILSQGVPIDEEIDGYLDMLFPKQGGIFGLGTKRRTK